MHDRHALVTLLRDAALRDVSTTVLIAPLRLPPREEFLWQYINLTPVGPLVDAAPAEAKAAMEQQVVERWQQFVVNGKALVDQPMVLAWGRR